MKRRRKKYREKKKQKAKLQKFTCLDSTPDACFDEPFEVDEQPCLPVKTDMRIHLTDYMSTADRLHVSANFVKTRDKEEQAKFIARMYRDRCTKLTAKVAQLELKQAKLRATFTNEKNQIRYFWTEQVLEGKSRSGRILKLALNN